MWDKDTYLELSRSSYENATRLFHSAKILLEQGRFPTSLVLSLHGQEEAGKSFYYLMCVVFGSANKLLEIPLVESLVGDSRLRRILSKRRIKHAHEKIIKSKNLLGRSHEIKHMASRAYLAIRVQSNEINELVKRYNAGEIKKESVVERMLEIFEYLKKYPRTKKHSRRWRKRQIIGEKLPYMLMYHQMVKFLFLGKE